mgnify:CR=1 FL=1
MENRQRQLPPTGFLRLSEIIGDRRKGILPIIPVSRSHWYDGIRRGIYPPPVRLSERTSAWPVQQILDLVEQLNSRK